MNDNLCFVINNNKLYFEKCLVDYDIPIFYTCRDNDKNRYIVLCCDADEMRYLVGKTSNSDIYQMLTKKITMKQVFEKAKVIWEVSTGDDYKSDEIINVKFEDIRQEDLPVEDSLYEIASKDVAEYCDLVKCESEGYKLKSYTKWQQQRIWYLRNSYEYLILYIPTYTFSKEIERKKRFIWESLLYRNFYKLKLDWESDDYLDNSKVLEPKTFLREVSCCE